MEKSKCEKQNMVIVCAVCFLSVLFVINPAWSAGSSEKDIIIYIEPGKTINLVKNQIAKFKVPSKYSRSAIGNGNKKIATIIETQRIKKEKKWVIVKGLEVGSTQLNIWNNDDELIGVFEIVVSPDVAGLKKSLYEIFPDENVSVRSSGDYITLTGTVSGAMKLANILKLAEAFAPDKVVNLLQIGGIQQVMLEVRIAEISKSVGSQLGINFGWIGRKGFGLSMLDNLTAIPEGGWPGNPITVSNSINAAIGFLGGDPVIVAIDALQEDGLLQILAKPTLIAQSGHSASFLAGGEFPFPIAQDFSRFSIEWKPFGIGLNFTPTVLGNDTISLVVSPEVSELDFTKTVSYAGYVVPSIDTRRMSTVVELKDNQSFAIAGLLKNYVRESVRKFPILGDIPILGALFRSTRYQKNETELIVIVTPHLVKPVDADELPLPTDSFESPSPFELLMLGMLEKVQTPDKEGEEYVGTESLNGSAKNPVMEGDFGYIVPE